MTKYSPDCFLATAQAFKYGRLSFEKSLDKDLKHFAGIRHSDDTIDTEADITDLTWEGPMGPVSAAMKLCILEPGFNAPPVKLLRPLLIACSSESLQSATTIDAKIESQCGGISAFGNPLLRQVMIMIAREFGNKDLEKLIIKLGRAPRRCLFTMKQSSLYGMLNEDLIIGRGASADSVRGGWVEADIKLIHYAVSSSEASPGIDLFEAIHTTGLDLSSTHYRSGLPILAAAYSEPRILQHLLDFFSIQEPEDELILWAVKDRKTGGVDMLKFLMESGIDVNWARPPPNTPFGGWGDPREQAQMNAAGNAGSETALHLSAHNGNVEAVKWLLDQGARTDMRDSLGRTPYDRAQYQNKTEVLSILK